jgi:hypothetical protein
LAASLRESVGTASKVGITLDLYSHVLPGMQEDAAAKVDSALRAAMTADTKNIG